MFRIENVSKGENIIKYTFCDLCWEKCKIAINHASTYQNLKILFNDQYEHILRIYVNDIEESHV
jgi:hypothetical protein